LLDCRTAPPPLTTVEQDRAMHNSPNWITRREALRRTLLVLGGTLSAPTLSALLAGCERAPRPVAVGALSAQQREMVATMADYIIPETDTPGARAVGVHDFIDQMMAQYYPSEEREIFLAGLAEVDERARQGYNRPFLDCTPEEQVALLVALDRESFPPRPEPETPDEREARIRAQPGIEGTPLPPDIVTDTIEWEVEVPRGHRADVPFWRTMKELTLVGYYTSEPGATQELRHEPVPGRYEGCVPYTQIGRTWAV
jgi:gluconate 2-dehydrogenase gamma chain